MPRISIIVPVYNVETYLSQCIESVLSQTMQDFELILVDDGSTDNCPQICDFYAKKYKQIQVIHQENGNIGKARNAGLAVASGQYILFLDSDDWLEPFTCEIMYRKIEETNVDLVLTGETCYIDDKKKYTKGWRDFGNKKGIEKYTDSNFINYFTPAWEKLYRKSFLDKHGLKFIEKCFYEDNSWGCFMILWAEKIAFVKNCYFYRQRSSSVTGKIDAKILDWFKDFKYFQKISDRTTTDKNKLKWCYFWYLLNFYNYYHRLTDKQLIKSFSYELKKGLAGCPLTATDIRNLCLSNNKDFNKLYSFVYDMLHNGTNFKSWESKLFNIIPLFSIEVENDNTFRSSY